MSTFVMGLKQGRLQFSIAKNLPPTFEALLQLAVLFISAEEFVREFDYYQDNGHGEGKDRGGSLSPQRRRMKPRTAPSTGDHKAIEFVPSTQGGGRPNWYASVSLLTLNRHIAVIMAAIQHKDCFRRSAPIDTLPEYSDKSKYCMYHDGHGHNTDECRSLRLLLERLIKEGHLQEFLKDNTSAPTTANKGKAPVLISIATTPSPPPRCNMKIIDNVQAIIGGASVEASRQRSLQNLTWSELLLIGGDSTPIIFSDANLPLHRNLYDNAIIIKVVINCYEVWRIMIDTRSSSNVLFRGLATKMRLNPRNFRPARGPLVKFSRERCMRARIVTLEVVLGMIKANEVRELDFLVMPCQSTPFFFLGICWASSLAMNSLK